MNICHDTSVLIFGAEIDGLVLYAAYDPYLDEIEVGYGGRQFEDLPEALQKALYEAAISHLVVVRRVLVATQRLALHEAYKRFVAARTRMQLMPQS